MFNRLCPDEALKHNFTVKISHFTVNILNFPTTKGLTIKISMKLIYQHMVIFFNFSPASNHLHPLQVENCYSNSRLVVDEDDNGKPWPERVKHKHLQMLCLKLNTSHFFTPILGYGSR